jgi:glyoxylase-like metal-dependent hydrolase (beta-lactamase superfamily II)
MTEAIFEELGNGIVCIDALYTATDIACCYLLESGDEYALIETGTARSVDNILATLGALGIDRQQLRYIIPTHVHLDHAGGAGQLMTLCAQAELLIHPRGARHMIDPTRLVASSREVYGPELFARLYGNIQPVEPKRVRELADGETVSLGQRKLTVRHTRGHADHHFCLFDHASRGWFSGDMFGISYRRQRYKTGSFVMPATTPTQFDPELYAQSVRELADAEPACCYLTHFSALPFERSQRDGLLRQLGRYAQLGDDYNGDPEHLERQVLQVVEEELLGFLPANDATQEAQALKMDIRLNAQGIAWWRQQRDRLAARQEPAVQ